MKKVSTQEEISDGVHLMGKKAIPPGPRDERGVLAARILTAAREAFADTGLAGTTIRAVAVSAARPVRVSFLPRGTAVEDRDLIRTKTNMIPEGVVEVRVVDIVGEYGNCIAASMPMALATAHADGRLTRGKRVLLIGTGAGMSIGVAIMEF